MARRSAAVKRTWTVLVVEDELLVAMLLEDMLVDLGHTIAGVTGEFDEALRLAKTAKFDLALLDVHLGGRDVFPVAEALMQRKIPFVFATGYGAEGLPPAFRGHPTLQKPFQSGALEQVLAMIDAD